MVPRLARATLPLARPRTRMATISHDYRKDTALPLGRGYSLRPSGTKPSAIVIHTTNSSRQNTAFVSEANYLRNSVEVSAHYLLGKQGQIAQILHPDLAAWHAGTAVSGFTNAHSIGIEAHVSVGEVWTTAQHDALTWLVRWLMGLYGISPAMIETHRAIALPHGRKSDPEGWPNPDFYAWRAGLAQPSHRAYRAVTCAPVFQDRRPDAPLALSVSAGQVEQIDDVTNGWLHLLSGAGFSPISCWEAL